MAGRSERLPTQLYTHDEQSGMRNIHASIQQMRKCPDDANILLVHYRFYALRPPKWHRLEPVMTDGEN